MFLLKFLGKSWANNAQPHVLIKKVLAKKKSVEKKCLIYILTNWTLPLNLHFTYNRCMLTAKSKNIHFHPQLLLLIMMKNLLKQSRYVQSVTKPSRYSIPVPVSYIQCSSQECMKAKLCPHWSVKVLLHKTSTFCWLPGSYSPFGYSRQSAPTHCL